MEIAGLTAGRMVVALVILTLAFIGWILMYRGLAHHGRLWGGLGASGVFVGFFAGVVWVQMAVESISPDQIRTLGQPNTEVKTPTAQAGWMNPAE